ncbi:MAG TPA: hypothetical protein VGC13_31385 [Longimicrobium sp.]|jgi:hypothetical protein|uniref:helix-turn-helix transcriptional regulator n=1 Tax=Longimicrobium sp. TaxID=2029185 RepID=UPI002ED92081
MDRRRSGKELDNINALKQLLASPGMYNPDGEWQDLVIDRLRAFLRADYGLFILGDGGPPRFSSAGIRPDEIENRSAFLENNEGNRRMQKLGHTVWTKDAIVAGEWSRYLDSREYLELFQPNRFIDGAGCNSITPHGDFAVLALFSEREGSLSRSEPLLEVLSDLAPDWKAGLTALKLFRASVDLLLAASDAERRSAFLFEPNGTLVALSENAEDLIADIEGRTLLEEARQLARDLGRSPGEYRPSKAARCPELSVCPERWKRTPHGLYRLVGTFMEVPGTWRRRILVSIDPWTRIPLSGEELRSLWGLSAPAIETAELFARGMSDGEIATVRGVLQNSVTRSLEKLRDKLGAPSKREMLKILRGEYRDRLEDRTSYRRHSVPRRRNRRTR